MDQLQTESGALEEIDTKLAVMPSLDEQEARLHELLDAPRDLRSKSPDVVRRRLQRLDLQIYAKQGKITPSAFRIE